MDTLTGVLLAGYVPMGSAVVYLFMEYKKVMNALLKQAQDHEKSMADLKGYLKKKNGQG